MIPPLEEMSHSINLDSSSMFELWKSSSSRAPLQPLTVLLQEPNTKFCVLYHPHSPHTIFSGRLDRAPRTAKLTTRNMSEEALNLARRNSIRNEPDLLRKYQYKRSLCYLPYLAIYCLTEHIEEDMMEPPSGATPPSSPLSRTSCFSLLSKVTPSNPLPSDCQKYDDVKVALQRRNSDRKAHLTAFEGMHSGDMQAAMAARERGHLHHAQIQRRMTSHKARSFW